MAKPIIAAIKPEQVDLEEGASYYFCTCGRSGNQPMCDGSHKGTGFSPMAFIAEAGGPAWLCRCKHTAKPPYCDGTHKQFSDENVGREGPGLS